MIAMLRRTISLLPTGIKGRHKALRILDRLAGPAGMRARGGVKIEGFFSSIQDLAFLRESSENPMLEHLIGNLPAGGCFIDVGANCGFYSSLAARKLGRGGVVLSFEPSGREYRRLLYANRHNGHECSWLTFNFACGESPEVLSLLVDDHHTGVNHIAAQDETGFRQSCLVVPLDHVVLGLVRPEGNIHLVKIDVEGFETSVVKGMTNLLKEGKIDRVCVEVTDKFLRRSGSGKDELYAIFEHHGYTPTVNSNEWQYDEVFVRKGIKE